MENYYLPEINPVGQKHVESWLSANGYSDIAREQIKLDEYGFTAKGKVERILVQTRTFLHPQRTFKLSDFEINSLTAKAVKLGRVAYAAYVTIDEKNNLAGDIIWERLS